MENNSETLFFSILILLLFFFFGEFVYLLPRTMNLEVESLLRERVMILTRIHFFYQLKCVYPMYDVPWCTSMLVSVFLKIAKKDDSLLVLVVAGQFGPVAV